MRRQIDEGDRSHELLQNLDDIASELQHAEISKKYQESFTPSLTVDGRRTQIGLLFLDPQLLPRDNSCCVSFRLPLISSYQCRHFSLVCVHTHKQTLQLPRDLLTRARREQNGYPQYCDGHWREDFYLAEELYIIDPKKMQPHMKRMHIRRLSTADKRKRLKPLATRLNNQGFIARPAQILSCCHLSFFPVFLALFAWHWIAELISIALIQYKHVCYV